MILSSNPIAKGNHILSFLPNSFPPCIHWSFAPKWRKKIKPGFRTFRNRASCLSLPSCAPALRVKGSSLGRKDV